MALPAKEIQLRGDSVLQLPFIPPPSLYGAKLGDLQDVDVAADTDGNVLTVQPDGTFALEELPAGLGAPEWGDLTGTLADQTDLAAVLAGKSGVGHGHIIADTGGLQSALDAKAASSHTHATSEVTGLDAALAGKAASSHTHAQSEVTNLTTDLAAKAPLASPALSGTPTVPTASAGTNSTQAASTAFVAASVKAATTPGLRASRYYGSFPAAAVTTFTLVANRLYYFPMFVPDATTFTRIGINVTTGAAGNARLGIYNNTNGVPSGAPLLDAGVVDVSTTGEKEIVISQALPVGWHWLAVVSDVAPTLTAENLATAVLLCNVGSLSGSAGNVTHVHQAFTFGALPTPSSITGANLTTPPRVWLRL